mgnify:FL=1
MIKVDGLTKYYGDRAAVLDVSFEVAEGEILGLLGLNGAGKTTILRILAGDLAASAGTVEVGGEPVDPGEPAGRRLVGFLPETPPLYPEMTVEGFLRFVAALREVPAAELATRTAEALGRFALDEVATLPVGALSYGYRKRLGLAQASIHRPRLLILDEPITGLDPVQIVDVRSRIRSLRGEATVILSSHILTEISQTCDRLLVIKDGRLVAQGTEEDLLRRHRGAQHLELELRAPAAAARQLVQGLPGVGEVRLVGEEQGVTTLTLTTAGDVRAALARAVVTAGHDLLRLQPGSGQLEGLFLQLTGSRLAETGLPAEEERT